MKNEILGNRKMIIFIGWLGTILIIMAYFFNSLSYLSSQGVVYPLLNLFGAIFLAIRVSYDRNWSNLVLEFFWGAIAIASLIKNFFL